MRGRSVVILAVIAMAGCASRAANERMGSHTEAERPMHVGAVTTLGASPGSADPLRTEEYLRGRVPGLEVIPRSDGSFRLRLRGGDLNLLNGRQAEPLVVIDGMPIAAELLTPVLRTLRPSDILRVEVLKDVASTSVYGMRGAGGVILIRTNSR
jgi:iron complex outermembrane receptor protein